MAKSGHRYSRSFFGPTPERVITQLQDKYRESGNVDEVTSNSHEAHTNSVARLIEKHAFTFFLSDGGSPEDWDDQAESTIKKKMMGRWLESEWSKAFHKQDHEHKRTPDRWVGDSFEIGDFLGIDILSKHRPTERLPQSCDVHQSTPVNGPHTSGVPGIHLGPGEPSPLAGPSNAPNVSLPPELSSVRVSQHALGEYFAGSDSPRSTVSIPTSAVPLLAQTNAEGHVLRGTSILLPSILLSIWRDRMLVHAYYSDLVFAGQLFNEEIHRTSRDLEYEAWGEFLVVWRREHIEIYEDYVCMFHPLI